MRLMSQVLKEVAERKDVSEDRECTRSSNNDNNNDE